MNFQYSPTFSDKRVITYGTFDLLHYGHINLLRRAKELGNYLVVGLASDAFNRDEKGKESYFSYHERRALLQSIRYVDLVIEETSWQQKISDIQLYKIDIFVIGDDWRGKFDALAEYCEIVYLPRTPEISTSKIKNDIAQTPKSSAGGGAELEFLSFLCRTTSIVIASETKCSVAITNQRIPNYNIEIPHVSFPRLLTKSRNDRKITQLMPYRHCERNEVKRGNLTYQTPTSYSILCLLIATLALLVRNDTKSLQVYIILMLQLSLKRAQQIWGALIVDCFGYHFAITTTAHNAFKGAA